MQLITNTLIRRSVDCFNEWCKLCCANASRHSVLVMQLITNTLRCSVNRFNNSITIMYKQLLWNVQEKFSLLFGNRQWADNLMTSLADDENIYDIYRRWVSDIIIELGLYMPLLYGLSWTTAASFDKRNFYLYTLRISKHLLCTTSRHTVGWSWLKFPDTIVRVPAWIETSYLHMSLVKKHIAKEIDCP